MKTQQNTQNTKTTWTNIGGTKIHKHK